jgi:putative transposase
MPPGGGIHPIKTSPEVIRLAVMLYVRFPLSLRNVEDLLHERGVEVSHGTVRFWWQCFGPMFAREIGRKHVAGTRSSRWRWHLVGQDQPAGNCPALAGPRCRGQIP